MLLADSENITALGCTFIIFGLPAVLWFVTRYMKYRERMALIQSGMNPYGPAAGYGVPNAGAYAPPNPGAYVPPNAGPQAAPPPGPGAYAPQPPPYVYDPRYSRKANRRMARANRDCMNETPEGQVRNGIRTSFIGMALTIGLSFIGINHDGFEAGPWLLGGLIPLFVGLSQIMNGVMSGAPNPFANRGYYMGPQQQPWMPPGPGSNAGRGSGGYGSSGNGAPGNGTPTGGPSNAGAPPPYDAYSYTYRPGVTPEIQPPPRPPERR